MDETKIKESMRNEDMLRQYGKVSKLVIKELEKFNNKQKEERKL